MLIDFVAGNVSDLYNLSAIIKSTLALQEDGFDIGYRLIYTGTKDKLFFNGSLLSSVIEEPNIFLDVNDTNHAATTGNSLIKYESILSKDKPNITLIYGRSNGVTGCAIAASKTAEIRLAHLGSGIRNNVRHSSDEINGRIIDSITDYHFPITQPSCENLRDEGVSDDYVFFVGNPITDVLANMADEAPPIWNLIQLHQRGYYLLNIENPSLLESHSRLKALILNIVRYTRNLPIILPITTDTRETIAALGVKAAALHIIDLHSKEHLFYLVKHAKAVITDSDNLQDESTYFQVPCMTLFKTVALQDTLETGTNEVIGLQADSINDAFNKLLNRNWKKGHIPYLWDGNVSNRIASTLKNLK